jgi:hypothetical protein
MPMPALLTRTSIGPAASTARADAVGVADIELENAQMRGTRQQVLARRAHRGDHLPVAFEEVAGGFQAKAGRAAGDEDGFHGNSSKWLAMTKL